ncbi:SPFH domain-containing protein, partial [Mitsuokella jalaludinii]
MGLIKAAMGAADGVMADQWKEFLYCDSLDKDTLAAKGQKRTSSRGRSSNTSGEDNIITKGSVIVVNEGQCMMIVEQGKVVEICAEPGEYIYDSSTEPTVFGGDLASDLKAVFRNMGKRFTFGGDAPKDQRVYYFNTKEIMGNKYGTPQSIQFETMIGPYMLNVNIRCFGEYSYRIANPILFYTNVCSNFDTVYERSEIDSQLKSELLTALQPAFGRIAAKGIRYTQLINYTKDIRNELSEELSEDWGKKRGIEIVSFGVSSVKAEEEDERRIKEIQDSAIMSNPDMRAGRLATATADAMRTAAGNEAGMGGAFGFMGMGMAGQMGAGAMGAFGQGAPSQGNPLTP